MKYVSCPSLSIVIPTYNRGKLIGRALKSCLSNDRDDIEVIVIDGSSTDNTLDVINSFNDPRIRIYIEGERRGVCAARNTGVLKANAGWIMFLDSDNELVLGAINQVIQEIESTQDDIEELRFTCKWSGSPECTVFQLDDEVWDYEGYLRFLKLTGRKGGFSETLCCIRSRSFNVIRWPDDRAFETEYHIDFAKIYKIRTCKSIMMIYHLDADNRNTNGLSALKIRELAIDNALSLERILFEHGNMVKKAAPNAYYGYLISAARYEFISGNRKHGTERLLEYLLYRPLSFNAWIILLSGLIGPGVISNLISFRHQISKR